MTTVRRALVVALVALGAAHCTRSEAPDIDPSDRTLRALSAERARLERQTKRAPEEGGLDAVLAAPLKREELGIPAGVNGQLEGVRVDLLEVSQSQTVGGGRVSLTTAERFVRVALRLTAQAPVQLSLREARLEQAGASFSVAQDVQRLAGTPLSFELQPGSARDAELYFELPAEAVSKGLRLRLSTGKSQTELTLQ